MNLSPFAPSFHTCGITIHVYIERKKYRDTSTSAPPEALLCNLYIYILLYIRYLLGVSITYSEGGEDVRENVRVIERERD